MATTLYLPSSSSAPAISPSPSTGWDVTSNFDRLQAVTTKTNTSMTNKAQTVSGSSTANLARQYIYGPLQAMTLSANTAWSLYVRGLESTALVNHFPAVGVWIATSTGSLRGTVRAGGSTGQGSEWETSIAARPFHPVTITYSSISVQDGDYLVVEVGTVSDALGGFGSVTLNFGDNAASNLAASGTTTADNPVFFLNADLAIYNPDISATVSQGTLTMTGQAMTGASAQATPSMSQGALTLTGQALTAARLPQDATASQGTLTLTGKALSGASADTYATVANQGVLTFDGQDVVASWEAPDTALLSRATLTLTGKAMSAQAESNVSITEGVLTLTGQAATVGAAVAAITDQGVITLTGQSVSASAILAAIVSRGTMTLTGKDLVAASANATTSALGRAQVTFTGNLVVVRQGFSFYQVAII